MAVLAEHFNIRLRNYFD